MSIYSEQGQLQVIVAIAIQHDFAYGSYCASATGTFFNNNTWPRLVHDSYCGFPVSFRINELLLELGQP